MRIDKFIWCIRLFKTRKLATEHCLKDRVKINEVISKPSKTIAAGDMISVYEQSVWRKFKILEVPKSRIGAKILNQYIREETEAKDLLHLENLREMNRINHLEGIKGRPTKKDRRDWEEYNG